MHFSGHGGPGELIFEDEYGQSRPVPIHQLLSEIRQASPEHWPRFFYLASCHGGDAPSLFDADTASGAGVAAAATQLHGEGIAQVVGYFGPIYDAQSTQAEAAFYAQIAQGHRTRDGVRAARRALAKPFVPNTRTSLRDSSRPGNAAATPFAWAQLQLYHRGLDWPLGQAVALRSELELAAPPSREEEVVFYGAFSSSWPKRHRHAWR